jgi:hypothetical protein
MTNVVNLSDARRIRPTAVEEDAADAAAIAAARAALAGFLSAVAPAERQVPGAEGVGLRELIREAAALLATRHGADLEEIAQGAVQGAVLALAEAGGAAG